MGFGLKLVCCRRSRVPRINPGVSTPCFYENDQEKEFPESDAAQELEGVPLKITEALAEKKPVPEIKTTILMEETEPPTGRHEESSPAQSCKTPFY